MDSITITELDIDKLIKELYDRSIKMSTTQYPHTYMNAVGIHEIERIIRKFFARKDGNDGESKTKK